MTLLHAALHRYLLENRLEGALPGSWSTMTNLHFM